MAVVPCRQHSAQHTRHVALLAGTQECASGWSTELMATWHNSYPCDHCRHAAERITQMGALEVVRTVAYWVFGLPLPAGPLTAIFFLPNSR